jgi:hypothetical protein
LFDNPQYILQFDNDIWIVHISSPFDQTSSAVSFQTHNQSQKIPQSQNQRAHATMCLFVFARKKLQNKDPDPKQSGVICESLKIQALSQCPWKIHPETGSYLLSYIYTTLNKSIKMKKSFHPLHHRCTYHFIL